jgi:hypothetical protein
MLPGLYLSMLEVGMRVQAVGGPTVALQLTPLRA